MQVKTVIKSSVEGKDAVLAHPFAGSNSVSVTRLRKSKDFKQELLDAYRKVTAEQNKKTSKRYAHISMPSVDNLNEQSAPEDEDNESPNLPRSWTRRDSLSRSSGSQNKSRLAAAGKSNTKQHQLRTDVSRLKGSN